MKRGNDASKKKDDNPATLPSLRKVVDAEDTETEAVRKMQDLAVERKAKKAVYQRQYRITHREERRAEKRQYRLANPEKRQAEQRRWYVKHLEEQREKNRIRSRLWRHEHPKQKRAQLHRYYLKHPEKKRVYAHRWRLKNGEKYRVYARKWATNNPDAVASARHRYRVRKRGNGYVEKFRRSEIFKRDGGRCQYCGVVVTEHAWDLDHIIPLSRGGNHSRSNVVVACVPCNRRKHNKFLTQWDHGLKRFYSDLLNERKGSEDNGQIKSHQAVFLYRREGREIVPR
jgi:5-methylcytosine-specific restriction endonuclease McrA